MTRHEQVSIGLRNNSEDARAYHTLDTEQVMSRVQPLQTGGGEECWDASRSSGACPTVGGEGVSPSFGNDTSIHGTGQLQSRKSSHTHSRGRTSRNDSSSAQQADLKRSVIGKDGSKRILEHRTAVLESDHIIAEQAQNALLRLPPNVSPKKGLRTLIAEESLKIGELAERAGCAMPSPDA